MDSFDSSITSGGGGSPSGASPGSADASGGGSGGGGSDGGGGGSASIDVGSLGIGGSMEFSAGDAMAMAAFGSAVAIAATSGGASAATAAMMGAFVLDMQTGDPLGQAVSHLSHDIGLGLMQVAQQQASAIAGAPVSVLGLWGTTASYNTATGVLNTGTTGTDYTVMINMNAGMALGVAYTPPYEPSYSASGGNGPQ